MFYKRKVYDALVKWKQEGSKKAILIEGLRQIGKSTLCEEFVNKNYTNVYKFDFRENEDDRLIFTNNFNLDSFKEDLFIRFKKEYNDNDAVLLLDEIGDCPNARAAIKYLLKETNFDIIATGSLLGVHGFSSRKKRSPSVGFTHYCTMHSFDFEEFLWANQIPDTIIQRIKESVVTSTPLDEKNHNLLKKLFKHYIITGGMPEAVVEYLSSHDFAKVITTNTDKLKEMQGDFGRVLDKNGEVTTDNDLLFRTNEVYSVLVPELAKDNAKFQFSMIRKGARSKEYEKTITWLEDYGLVCKCYNLKDLKLPLEGYENIDSYKLYFGDIGLYIAKMGLETASLLLGNELDSYGGYIYEGIAADILNKADFPLYYFDNGKSELDFIIQDDNKLAIIEVKMNKGKSKSAKAIMEGKSNHHADICYRVTDANFSLGTYYKGVPHYALPFLLEYIKTKLLKSLIVEPVKIEE